jgi:hypothetical protein
MCINVVLGTTRMWALAILRAYCIINYNTVVVVAVSMHKGGCSYDCRGVLCTIRTHGWILFNRTYLNEYT